MDTNEILKYKRVSFNYLCHFLNICVHLWIKNKLNE